MYRFDDDDDDINDNFSIHDSDEEIYSTLLSEENRSTHNNAPFSPEIGLSDEEELDSDEAKRNPNNTMASSQTLSVHTSIDSVKSVSN